MVPSTPSPQVVANSDLSSLIAIVILCCMVSAGCGGDPRTESPPRGSPVHTASQIPTGLDLATAAQLTERIESEHFVFYLKADDSISVDRQEAFHQWAVDYLDISLPKKIDYYKFSFGDMRAAVGRRATGRGFPQEYALATVHGWHPHEAMHIYTFALCGHATVRLYDEGMAVAHEFDPLNGSWVSHWDLWSGRGSYIYAETVREHRAAGRLYAIEEVLESRAFDEARRKAASTFGIDRMKQAICSVTEADTRETIMREFEEVFGISIRNAEKAWFAYLDASM